MSTFTASKPALRSCFADADKAIALMRSAHNSATVALSSSLISTGLTAHFALLTNAARVSWAWIWTLMASCPTLIASIISTS